MASWHFESLTTSGNAAYSPSLTSYVFEAQGTRHVDYGGDDGHVHELWWDANGWHSNDLTLAANASTTVGGLIDNFTSLNGYVFNAQGTQHVNYLGADGDWHELWWDTNGWHDNDLSVAAGLSPLRPPQGQAQALIASYAFAAQNTQHVIYFATDDSDIHELWWGPETFFGIVEGYGWHSNDLTTAAGAPNGAAIAGAGYVFDAQGTQHVDYVGDDGHIHELWWDANGSVTTIGAGGWHYNDLTVAANAPATISAVSVTSYVFDAQGTQHVDYVGNDGHVHELWWDTNGWHYNDLTAAANAPALGEFASVITSYVFDAQGTQHVDYVGNDGHVHELWWDTNGWHYNDLTAAANAPLVQAGSPITGCVFAAQGTQHIDYIGEDGNIYELWWG
jgi:hypothetical protein